MVPSSCLACRTWLRRCLTSASDTISSCCILRVARIALRAQRTRPPSPWLRSAARGPGKPRRRYGRCRSRRLSWRRCGVLRYHSCSMACLDRRGRPRQAIGGKHRRRGSAPENTSVGSLEPGPRVGVRSTCGAPLSRERGPEGRVGGPDSARTRHDGFPPRSVRRGTRRARGCRLSTLRRVVAWAHRPHFPARGRKSGNRSHFRLFAHTKTPLCFRGSRSAQKVGQNGT